MVIILTINKVVRTTKTGTCFAMSRGEGSHQVKEKTIHASLRSIIVEEEENKLVKLVLSVL